MSGRERLPLFPSRANLVMMKQRILAANKGLSLLKRKRDALELKARELKAELKIYQEKVDGVVSEAIFSMARANYLGTDFKPASVMAVDRADAFMRLRSQRVAGLLLPILELTMKSSTCFPLTGLSRGGTQVEVVREKFQEALRTLVLLASLQYSVRVLDDGLRQTNMRINGLEYVVIPRFVNTVAYIRDELDEYEREEFYRLKRSQAKQRRNKAAFTDMVKKKNLTPEELERLRQQMGELDMTDYEDFRPMARSSHEPISTQTSFVDYESDESTLTYDEPEETTFIHNPLA